MTAHREPTMDVSVCADYAERMRHGIIAAAERKKRGGHGYDLMRWLAVPLELAKEHDARLVPCLIFLVDQSHFIPAEALSNIVSVLKGIMFFDEDALDAFLEIDEIRHVTPTRTALRELGAKMSSALDAPDEELVEAAFQWLYAHTN